jgi:hypothetical protein
VQNDERQWVLRHVMRIHAIELARAGGGAPGTVAISDATHRLVSGLFVVEYLGAQQFKGIEQPLQLYRVVRPSGVLGRFQRHWSGYSAAPASTALYARSQFAYLKSGRCAKGSDRKAFSAPTASFGIG